MSGCFAEAFVLAGVLTLALFATSSSSAAESGAGGITAAAFGDIYDLSDGAKPKEKGGDYFDIVSGDSWYSTWARDGTAYIDQDDGLGFNNVGGQFARHRLCRLDGDPNVATGSFWGVNLNPGLLGATMPNNKNEGLMGYGTSLYDLDGVLFEIRHGWSPEPNLWPPLDSNIIKSADGGKTWINHLGQVNAPLPGKGQAMFPALPWSGMTFIQYGKGGQAPNADHADQYVYLTATDCLARVSRNRLGNLNRNDFEYFKGGALDGMRDSSWSKKPAEGQPMVFEGPTDAGKNPKKSGMNLGSVVYNDALKSYVGTSASSYLAPGEQGPDKGKVRFIIYTAAHPWGPWHEVLSYGIWGRAGWNLLLCNKFTTADGKKMWHGFSGEYHGDLWNYGLQYMPLYLSTGPVDTYEAEKAALAGTSVAADYPSFSGSGYVAGFGKTGDRITFALDNINGQGWHIVRIRYTSPQANGRTLSVYVNGKKARRVRLSLNNSDCQPRENWTDRSDIYYLNQGANTFELRQDEGESAAGVLIDYVAVSRDETFNEGTNVAPAATATASSGDAALGTKGCVDGLREWTAKGTKGEWLKLDWGASGKTVQKVVLYDLVSPKDQVLSGTLSFSGGPPIRVGRVQNDGQAGAVITFPPRRNITWIKFTVDAISPGSEHAGLGEMEVYTPSGQ
jgi:hypothetical protein